MQYTKPALTFEEQADLIISRGLVVDRAILIDVLKNVNYYRLSGYLYPYRTLPGDEFKPGTTFDQVWRHYTFDRQLRVITMDALERFEVSIKNQIINFISKSFGPFGYIEHTNFPYLSADDHATLLKTIAVESERSKEEFVRHFRLKYGDTHPNLPLWMSGEIISFGCSITMFRGIKDKSIIVDHYGVPKDVLISWLKTLNVIRNICAHHGRLWNRELGVKPYIPRKKDFPQWHEPVTINNNRVFGILTILNYLLKIAAPKSNWKLRLFTLLDEYSEISKRSMGFTDNWKDSILWK
jgi:abortive infection bacteriophage resistance protein